jgi:hypothetical protein
MLRIRNDESDGAASEDEASNVTGGGGMGLRDKPEDDTFGVVIAET